MAEPEDRVDGRQQVVREPPMKASTAGRCLLAAVVTRARSESSNVGGHRDGGPAQVRDAASSSIVFSVWNRATARRRPEVRFVLAASRTADALHPAARCSRRSTGANRGTAARTAPRAQQVRCRRSGSTTARQGPPGRGAAHRSWRGRPSISSSTISLRGYPATDARARQARRAR